LLLLLLFTSNFEFKSGDAISSSFSAMQSNGDEAAAAFAIVRVFSFVGEEASLST
jgi:hypothetical protein